MTSPHWYALYTKPKNEKKVAQRLTELGIEVYCPLTETLKVWSDRKKKIKEPLFKSYVFVHVMEAERESVFQAHGVVRYVYWLGQPAVIRDEEILAIREFLEEISAAQHDAPFRFEYLQELEVVGGPFKGLKGRYLHRKRNRLVLLIESLGVAIKADLHHSQVS